MGGSFFTADGESWRRQRARAQEITSSPRLAAAMARFCRDKVETGLLPLLRHMHVAAAPFDLHDVFRRLAFDMTATAVFGVDPDRLCIDMPPTQFSDSMDTVMEVASCWRLMRWLNIGPERKLAAAQPVLRRFVAEMVEKRRRGGGGGGGVEQNGAPPVDIVSGYMNDPEYIDEDDKPRGFLYDTLITYMFAGGDTVSLSLSWLLYNLIRHPDAVSAIRGELAPIDARKAATTAGGMVVFEPEETKPLVYLHAALFESMRLYPPAPIELKEALADDVLPSGHKVRAGDKVLVGLYAMGRMEGVWGEDCREYQPERWVTQTPGGLRHVPAHKFLVFNAGPRSCLGKNVSVAQMKCVAAAVVWNFDFEEVEGHAVEQKLSVMLQMNGLMVKAKKRDVTGGH